MKFTMTRLVLVWMLFPFAFGLPAILIGGLFGCRMDPVGPHPCEILGLVDIGSILGAFYGFLFIAPFTVVSGIMIAIPLFFAKLIRSVNSQRK